MARSVALWSQRATFCGEQCDWIGITLVPTSDASHATNVSFCHYCLKNLALKRIFLEEIQMIFLHRGLNFLPFRSSRKKAIRVTFFSPKLRDLDFARNYKIN